MNPRPVLTEAQAARVTRDSVLRLTGSVAQPREDPWTPADDSLPAPDHVVGAGGIATLQEAVDLCIAGNDQGCAQGTRKHIRLRPGDHAGPVYLPPEAPPLTISADHGAVLRADVDAEMTGHAYRARFGAAFASAHPATRRIFEAIAARGTITTGNASVLRIGRDDTQLHGLRIVNDYSCTRPEAVPEGAHPDAEGRYASGQHQAVALHVAGADRVLLSGLSLSSFQDTLYLETPDPFTISRVALRDCEIEGDVDFIFGQATAHFERCTIRSRGTRGAMSWATAPSTNIRAPFGFVFEHCDFVHDGTPEARKGYFLLGRQWFQSVRATPYGVPPDPDFRCVPGETSTYDHPRGTISRATLEAVGKCLLLNCRLGAHLNAAMPWGDWNGGCYDARGTYHPGPWHPRFRPVQRHYGDMRAHLDHWLDAHGIDLAGVDSDAPWLGDYGSVATGP